VLNSRRAISVKITLQFTASGCGGAGFLVLSAVLPPGEFATLRQLVSTPVYARGLAPEEAWALAAGGINETNDEVAG
jgi:hypothetical protein